MTADAPVHTQDLIPVHSRVSWGAILAGSMLALALYFLLALLGGAVGFSISHKVTAHTLAASSAVYAILVTALCLFAGGFVASQFTTGETRSEGCQYGIFVWATVFAALLWLMASGVKVGYTAVVGVASAGYAVADGTGPGEWEAAARQAGVPQERLEEWKKAVKDAPSAAKQAAENPENQKAAEAAATRASWYAFFGAWFSMAAACAGGYFGSGPTFRIVTTPVGRTYPGGQPVNALS